MNQVRQESTEDTRYEQMDRYFKALSRRMARLMARSISSGEEYSHDAMAGALYRCLIGQAMVSGDPYRSYGTWAAKGREQFKAEYDRFKEWRLSAEEGDE
jgi:hypothetical protein